MSSIAVPVVKPGEKPPPFAELAKMYAYDASAPLNVRDQEFAQLVGTDAHTARAIVYAGAGREVNAYLFAPKGEGPFPAWDLAEGGVLCRACLLGGRPIRPESAEVIARIVGGDLARVLADPPADRVLAEVERLAIASLEYHSERRLRSAALR